MAKLPPPKLQSASLVRTEALGKNNAVVGRDAVAFAGEGLCGGGGNRDCQDQRGQEFHDTLPVERVTRSRCSNCNNWCAVVREPVHMRQKCFWIAAGYVARGIECIDCIARHGMYRRRNGRKRC